MLVCFILVVILLASHLIWDVYKYFDVKKRVKNYESTKKDLQKTEYYAKPKVDIPIKPETIDKNSEEFKKKEQEIYGLSLGLQNNWFNLENERGEEHDGR